MADGDDDGPLFDVLSDLREVLAPTSFSGTIKESPMTWLRRFNKWADLRGLTDDVKTATLQALCNSDAQSWSDAVHADWTYEQVQQEFLNTFHHAD